MNWEVINNERSSLQEYRLIDKDAFKVILKYNPLHQTARITSGTSHRLFFLESAGSLSGTTIFRNEYGMETGRLVHDKYHPESGVVLIDNKRYQYQLKNNPLSELVIYENGLQNPIGSCTLPPKKNSGVNNISATASSSDTNCFLLGLCWFLLVSGIKDNAPRYASEGV